MATRRRDSNQANKPTLFDSTVIREAQEAMDFMANVLEASTEYSIIGKDLDGKILLWNEGARRMYGYEPEEVVGRANAEILHTPEDVAVGMPQKIMDIAMHNGKWEVARRLKSRSALRRIPLIAVTAFAMVGDRDKVLVAGFDGYIAKPIQPETFVRDVEAFVSPNPIGATATGGWAWHSGRPSLSSDLSSRRPCWQSWRTASEADLRGMHMATILVIDDTPADRALLVTLLGYRGHRLLEACDGAEGLAKARVEPPDLIISDILMPTMDGYELVRQLRADPATAQTPVLFYTANYLAREAQALAYEGGVSQILLKPCDPEAVLRTVDGVLNPVPPATSPPVPEAFDRQYLRRLSERVAQQATELAMTNQRLATLAGFEQQLISERCSEPLLDIFCRAARALTGAKYAVVVFDDTGQTARHVLTSGVHAEILPSQPPPALPHDLLTTLLQERRPVRLHTTSNARQPVSHSLEIKYPTRHFGAMLEA